MRLFVAVATPPDVLADVDAALGAVRGLQPELRWIPRERWHLTLAFYGEVPDASLAGVIDMVGERLSRRPDGRPFELLFAGAGQFARRAMWVGVDGEVDQLRRLAKAVTTDRRPYRAHLTVARLRGGQDAAPVVAAMTSYAGPRWRVDAMHLVRSFLGPQPRYESVGSWPVGSGPDD